jgi:WD40 repeat protein
MGLRERVAVTIAIVVVLAVGVRVYWWSLAWPARLEVRTGDRTWTLAFSPDGSTLATTGPDGLTFWNTANGHVRARVPFAEHRTIYAGRFTPDGQTFAGLSYGGQPQPLMIDLFDFPSGKLRGSVPTRHNGIIGFAVIDEGQAVRAIVTARSPAQVLDCAVSDGRVLRDRALSCPSNWGHTSLSEDGRIVSLVHPTQNSPPGAMEVVLWDVELDRQIAVLPPTPRKPDFAATAVNGHQRSVAIARADGSIELRDLNDFSLRKSWTAHKTDFVPIQLQFSPDGARLISIARYTMNRRGVSVRMLHELMAALAGNRNWEPPYELLVFDLASGRRLGRTENEARAVFTPNGQTLATSDIDGRAKLRDLPTKP